MLKQPTFSSSLTATNVYFEKKTIKDYGALSGENQFILSIYLSRFPQFGGVADNTKETG